MSRTRLLLLMSAAIPLAACGADDVASPGEGNIVIVTPPAPPAPPAPTPTPPAPTPTPPPSGARFADITPADTCPMGTSNTGTIDGDDDGTVDFRICQLSGTITGTVNIERLDGVVYSLGGRVDVGVDVGGDGQAADGEQGVLNVDPGVTFIGAGTSDFLLVQRGSQLNAIGTRTQPIVFTARANFNNETDGTGTVNADSIGLFGGLVILGRGPINDCDASGVDGGTAGCQTAIEGTTGAFFGGDQPDDDSGTMRYVQVRYPGFEVSLGNELNGISMGGVGSGTEFSYIQVHNSSDDGIEWFGGTVNGDHIVITGADDDSLDIDSGYSGVNQFIIVRQRAAGGDHYIESDSKFDDEPRTNPTIANFTFYGGGGAGDTGILQREGISEILWNGVVVGKDICLDLDDDETLTPGPEFQSVVLDCPTAFADDGNITAAQIETLFNMGSNNDSDFDSSLTDGFINGPAETAVTAFNDPLIETVDYIGAVAQGATPWTEDWTCGLFGSDDQGTGSALQSCLVTPFYG